MTSVKKSSGHDLLAWGLEGIQQPESTANYQELQRAMQSGVISEDLPFSRGQIREPAARSAVASHVSGTRKQRRIQPSEKMKQLEDYEKTMEDHKALSILKMDARQDVQSYDSEEDYALDNCSPQEASAIKMPLVTQPNIDGHQRQASLLGSAPSEHLMRTPSVQNYRNF